MSLELDEEPNITFEELHGKLWVEGGYVQGDLSPITEDVAAVHNGSHIKFVFLKSGRSRVFVPPDNAGVGTIGSRDDLAVLAWSDQGPNPDLHVFQYTSPADIKNLKGDALVEYVALALNQESLLVALSGVPDFKLTLWDWVKEERIISVPSNIMCKDVKVSFALDTNVGGSKMISVASRENGLSIWKVKRCGKERQFMCEPLPNANLERIFKNNQSSTWHQGNVLYILTKDRHLHKYDMDRNSVSEISLQNITLSSGWLEIRAHYEHLILFSAESVMLMTIEGNIAHTIRLFYVKEQLEKQIFECQSSFSFMCWTEFGNICQFHSSERDVASLIVWENEYFVNFIDVAFVRPDEITFVALDDRKTIHIYDSTQKKKVMQYSLPVKCHFIKSHPNLPILLAGSDDGRVFVLGVKVTLETKEMKKVEKSPGNSSHSQDSDPDTLVEEFLDVDVIEIGEVVLHHHPLTLAIQEETLGMRLLIQARDGMLFLLDLEQETDHLDQIYPVKSGFKMDSNLLDSSYNGDTVLCLLSHQKADSPIKSWLAAGRTVCRLKVLEDEMRLVNTIHLDDLCCGIAIDPIHQHRFITLITKTKSIAQYQVPEESSEKPQHPITKRKTVHQINVNKLIRCKNDFMSLGKDGIVQVFNVRLFSQENSVIDVGTLYHYQRGGVKQVVVNESRTKLLAIDEVGSLQILNLKKTDLIVNVACDVKVSENKDLTKFAEMISKRTAFTFPEEVTVQSWFQLANQRAVAKKKLSYEQELSEIEESLADITENVSDLLEKNLKLPRSERLEGSEFELNIEEKQQKIQEGLEKETALKVELKAWHLARMRVGQRVRKCVWDDMEVKGRAIKSFDKEIIVRNYPLLPLSEDEQKDLDLAMDERKMSKCLESLTDNIKDCPTEAIPSPRSKPESPQVPSRVLSPDQSANVSRRQSNPPRSDQPSLTVDNSSSPSRIASGFQGLHMKDPVSRKSNDFHGSLSHKFIDVESFELIEQIDITTKMQLHQQMTLLKNLVRKLKMSFNTEFNALVEEKCRVFEAIQACLEKLESVEDAGMENEISFDKSIYEWSAMENPELDLPKFKREDKISSVSVPNPEIKQQNPPNKEKPVVIIPPSFMDDKAVVEYSPAELSATEEFRTEIKTKEKSALSELRLESNDNMQLRRQIEGLVDSFDKKVLELYQKKLAIEKCVLTEQLKILLHDRHLAELDDLDREGEQLMEDLISYQAKKELSERQLQDGQNALVRMKELLTKFTDVDKTMEKDVKKRFSGLNYNQLEALIKCYRQRPVSASEMEKTVDLFTKKELKKKQFTTHPDDGKKIAKDLKTKSIGATLERMSNMFLGTALTKTGEQDSPAASGNVQAMTIEELDKPSNCPENVDMETWQALCDLRRKKIESEKNLATITEQLSETAESVVDREATAAKAANGLKVTRELLEDWRKRKNHVINNVEVVLCLPRGQIEVATKELDCHLSDAVLLTDEVIDKLNEEIERLGEAKWSAMTVSKNCQTSTKMCEWEKDKLTLELEELQSKWTDIQHTKLSKESRLALHMESAEKPTRVSITEDYALLDKASKSMEDYLDNRHQEYDKIIADLQEMTKVKAEENASLAKEVEDLEQEVQEQRIEVNEQELRVWKLKGSERLSRAMKKNRLLKMIEEQHQLIMSIQDQLDTYMFKSFPSLG